MAMQIRHIKGYKCVLAHVITHACCTAAHLSTLSLCAADDTAVARSLEACMHTQMCQASCFMSLAAAWSSCLR